MSDRLHTLEQQAASGDLPARAAWVQELLRLRDPRVVAVEEREARLAAHLKGLQAAVEQWLARWPAEDRNRCPDLEVRHVRLLVRGALAEREGGDFNVAHKLLAKVYPTRRPADVESFEDLPTPWAVIALVARLGQDVVLRVGHCSHSRSPSPGTVWPGLSPWRENAAPASLEPKLRRWAADPSPAERLTADEARLWVDVAARRPRTEHTALPPTSARLAAAEDPDRPSEKQLRFIKDLKRKKHLTADELSALLQEHAGVSDLDALRRREASSVIDALLALPAQG